MIAKNEAHIVHEALEAVAPYIDYWVIVDTGSTDGTQDVIRSKMADLGIPGELHERPWRDFGYNRTEALQLAQGHADYIWVMDADDTIEGTVALGDLTADGYSIRVRRQIDYWRLHLFRDGVPWRYEGVVHELAVCDEPHSEELLDGDFRILSRGLGARSLDPLTFHRDCEVLLAEVRRNPEDERSVLHLAMTYEYLGDHANARTWFARHAQIGLWDPVIYYSMLGLARAMSNLGEPWSDVLEAYLQAFEFRPVRAEALNTIAVHYRKAARYEMGYVFAKRAAEIPLPEGDTFFVEPHVHQWAAADEQAVCASWIGRGFEAMGIWRRLLTRDDVPDEHRVRIVNNRDHVGSQLVENCAAYPLDLVRRPPGRPDAEVTVSISTGSDRTLVEATLNSFLTCCTDRDWVGRFVIEDTDMTPEDRGALAESYPFLEFSTGVVRTVGRYVLQLPQGWRFFTEEALLARLIGVLQAEPEVARVGVNLGDARHLTPDSPARTGVRTTTSGGRYVLTAAVPEGPVMIDTTRAQSAITATLDEVLCIHE